MALLQLLPHIKYIYCFLGGGGGGVFGFLFFSSGGGGGGGGGYFWFFAFYQTGKYMCDLP